jgi:hypothetical protein
MTKGETLVRKLVIVIVLLFLPITLPLHSAAQDADAKPVFHQDLSWSPDGKLIAFTSSRDGQDEIYLMNAHGFGQKKLTGTN